MGTSDVEITLGSEAALLVIDVQVSIMDGSGETPRPAYRRDEVLARIDALLTNARAAKVPVIYLQHDDATYAPMFPGEAGWQIHPAVAPAAGDLVIRKRASDGFYATSLRSELDARGVTHLVVAGADTEFCVDTTVRRALSLDYEVILAADAHTTSSDGGLPAEQIVAYHNALLAYLPHPKHEIRVVPASEIAFAPAGAR